MVAEPPINLTLLDWLIIIFFFILVIGIGLSVSRKRLSFDDYFVAGRAVTSPLLVFTLVSTFYGLGAFFGTAAVGYMSGIVALFSFSFPFYLMFIIMAILAPKIYGRKTKTDH